MKRKNRLMIELPEEFIHRCQHDGVTPETVLRGFIADLCSIRNCEDGYTSNGSDERYMAKEYYERVGYPYWNR